MFPRPRRRLLLAGLLLAACGADPAPARREDPPRPATLRMATTTSTRDSGLLDVLLPLLEREEGIRVEVLAVGSGQALRIGADGDADLLMTHDPKGEEEFVASGAGIDRRPLMYNDFVLVGPAADPAKVRGMTDARKALAAVAAAAAPFLSRGDDSGTHRREVRLWREAGVAGKGSWYRETGQGMGETLALAAETSSYALADRSTWAAHAAAPTLPVLVEGDPLLRNPYAVLLVNPARHPHVKAEAARRAADWLTGPAGRRAIEGFRPKGAQLFFLLPGN